LDFCSFNYFDGPVVIDLFKKTLANIRFFAFMMVLQLIFVVNMMPETKGLSLEELEHKMQNNGK
jgi:hypothetical protein